jgi:hypothetical protein
LELAQLLEHDRVPEVDVRGRRVQTELDAQRAAGRELLRERAAREVVDGVAREVRPVSAASEAVSSIRPNASVWRFAGLGGSTTQP